MSTTMTAWSSDRHRLGARLRRRTGLAVDVVLIPRENRRGPWGLFFFDPHYADDVIRWGYEGTVLGLCVIVWKFRKNMR